MHYQNPDSTTLLLTGLMGTDRLYVKMKKLSPNNYELLKRGFQWINEYPYNR